VNVLHKLADYHRVDELFRALCWRALNPPEIDYANGLFGIKLLDARTAEPHEAEGGSLIEAIEQMLVQTHYTRCEGRGAHGRCLLYQSHEGEHY
jgi:hypothetical protein